MLDWRRVKKPVLDNKVERSKEGMILQQPKEEIQLSCLFIKGLQLEKPEQISIIQNLGHVEFNQPVCS